MSYTKKLKAYLDANYGALTPIERCLALWRLVDDEIYVLVLLAEVQGVLDGAYEADGRGEYILLLALQERIHEAMEMLESDGKVIEDYLIPLTHRVAKYRLANSSIPEPIFRGKQASYSGTHCYWRIHRVTGISIDNIRLWISAAILDGVTNGELDNNDFESFCSDCDVALPENINRWRKGNASYLKFRERISAIREVTMEELGITHIVKRYLKI